MTGNNLWMHSLSLQGGLCNEYQNLVLMGLSIIYVKGSQDSISEVFLPFKISNNVAF